MFHIEQEIGITTFWQFVEDLGPETRRQFDQFNDIVWGSQQMNMWNDMMKNRHNFYAMIDDELIAYAFLQRFAKKQNVVSLGVVMADKYHGKGYGKPLYKHVVDWGLEHYNKVWSAVYEDNYPVLHIHKWLGFELEGVFVDELNDGRSIYSVAKFKHPNSVKREELVRYWNSCK